MSKLKSLALAGAFTATVALFVAIAAPAGAQTRPTVTTSRPAATATPLRPAPIRPGGDRGGNIEERLRYACFTAPNPPVPTCRRWLGGGDGPSAGRPN